MTVEAWDEIRTSYFVAKLGTVSGAAEALGVHHATVIRHVDALEARLGTKLFQRHARGYTPTEAGLDLLQVAGTTDDQFTQLVGRIRGRGSDVAGEVIVTSLPSLSARLAPLLVEFMEIHPDIRVRFLTDNRLFKLEYGEAHVAIRAGMRPDQPDNVVQPLAVERQTLYAARRYIERYGPLIDGEWEAHRYVAPDEMSPRAPFLRWMLETIPADRIFYRASQFRSVIDAIRAGAGIGFMAVGDGHADENLVEMLPPREEWHSNLWLVTHVDLHRTAKVQTLVAFLKQKAADLA
ncbi:LysR family transcriptional regulator [Tropicimonas isoalkanivorans]|uniref:Transcriptional regulator, LysR family n=1 Tax=Tropicimonas isoalkanivorans TaxID=441112 RepID=A0A1I1JVQ7_9RHOB|nr:LysR family transcriptional regulator [Tropicimonas isoalkanivorans]SFC50568.1 transcriptional regulator, LysR family [Tropicimonas isoalkanivorans]